MPAYDQILYKQIDGKDNNIVDSAFTGYRAGVDRAMNLQAQQAKLEYLKTENQQRKLDLDMKSTTYANDYLAKGLSLPEGKQRNAYMDSYQDVLQKTNRPPATPEFVAWAKTDPDAPALIGQLGEDLKSSDPASRMRAANAIQKLHMAPNPMDAAKLANEYSQANDKINQTKALFGNRLQMQDLKTLGPYMTAQERVDALGHDPARSQAAMMSAQDKYNQAMGQQRTDKSQNIQSQVSERERGNDIKEENTDSLIETRKGTLAARLQSVNLAAQRLGLQTTKKDMALNQGALNAPAVTAANKSLLNAGNANTLLSKIDTGEFTYKDANELVVEINRLLSNSSVMPQGRVESLGLKSLPHSLAEWKSYFKGYEDTSVPNASGQRYFGQLKDRFLRIKEGLENGRDQEIVNRVRTNVKGGFYSDPKIGQILLDQNLIRKGALATGSDSVTTNQQAPQTPESGARAGRMALKPVAPATIQGLMKNLAVPGDTDGSKTKNAVRTFLDQRGVDSSGVK